MINYLAHLPTSSLMGLANHLWQSSLFAVAVWLLAAAFRRNQARVRYALWMVASIKFLVPFSLLVWLGALIRWPSGAHISQPALSPLVEGIASPFFAADTAVMPSSTPAGHALSAVSVLGIHHINWAALLLVIWTCGVLLILGRWTKLWWQLRTSVRHAKPMTIAIMR